uniref:Uncharacterized protein n=1 Tax=Panulirus argus virus 1 TaxID=380624 RepID=A0A6G9HDM0_9VIRU|nr:hypothetical protein [Panulirus argus virus 1]
MLQYYCTWSAPPRKGEGKEREEEEEGPRRDGKERINKTVSRVLFYAERGGAGDPRRGGGGGDIT